MGSEMCIRDRRRPAAPSFGEARAAAGRGGGARRCAAARLEGRTRGPFRFQPVFLHANAQRNPRAARRALAVRARAPRILDGARAGHPRFRARVTVRGTGAARVRRAQRRDRRGVRRGRTRGGRGSGPPSGAPASQMTRLARAFASFPARPSVASGPNKVAHAGARPKLDACYFQAAAAACESRPWSHTPPRAFAWRAQSRC